MEKIDLKPQAEYCIKEIEHICAEIGPRIAGSKQERDALDYLDEQIKANEYADTTSIEEFKVAPKAFLVYVKIIPFLMFIGIGLYFVAPVVLAVLSLISLALIITQLVFYKLPLKIFFRKKTSANLIATKKPTGEVKRRIIFSGHVDSAYEWSLAYAFGYTFGKIIVGFGVVGAFAGIGLGIAGQVTDGNLWVLLPMAAFVWAYPMLFFFVNFRRGVDGANDNLTGTLAAVAILKHLKENNITFENTEVVCAVMGSEEVGLVGAFAYNQLHKEMLHDPNVETVYIGLETFEHVDYLSVYKRDMCARLLMHPRAIGLLDDAATVVDGKPLPHAAITLGASDAAAFRACGVPAVTIAAMDPSPAEYYHTRNDTVDGLNLECIQKALEISVEALNIFDGGSDKSE